MPNSPSFYAPESLSAIGMLVAAVVTLWRALQAKEQAIQKLIAETIEREAAMVRALDRLEPSEGLRTPSEPPSRHGIPR